MVAHRRAINRLAVERASEQRRNLGPGGGFEQVLERVQRQQFRMIHAKASLPGRIGVEKLSGGAERRDHLARVLEQIAIPLLRLAQSLFLAERRTLVEGHDHQARECARSIALGGDVQRDREQRSVAVTQLCLKAGYLAGGKRANALDVLGQFAAWGWLGSLRAVLQLQDLLHQALGFAGSQNLAGVRHADQFRGMVPQQPFRRGIDIRESTVETGGHHHRAGRIEQFLERLADGRGCRQGVGRHAKQQPKRQRGTADPGGSASKVQEGFRARAGRQKVCDRSRQQPDEESGHGGQNQGQAAQSHRRGGRLSGRGCFVGRVVHLTPQAAHAYATTVAAACSVRRRRTGLAEAKAVSSSHAGHRPERGIRW
jgi:hypothetical protein